MLKLNVLVAGSTGYIGVQLINLLIKHPNIKIKYLCGNSSVGKNISSYEKSLSSKKLPKIIKYNRSLLKNVDLVFTALPNGEAQDISNDLLKHNVLIDLAADFRLNKASDYLKWYKQKHRSVKNIKKSINILCFNKSFEISCASPLGKAVKTRSTFFKRDLLYLMILGNFFELNDFS